MADPSKSHTVVDVAMEHHHALELFDKNAADDVEAGKPNLTEEQKEMVREEVRREMEAKGPRFLLCLPCVPAPCYSDNNPCQSLAISCFLAIVCAPAYYCCYQGYKELKVDSESRKGWGCVALGGIAALTIGGLILAFVIWEEYYHVPDSSNDPPAMNANWNSTAFH
ncbi:unnamed protein product, partial [Mesorhabditis spiculigera]